MFKIKLPNEQCQSIELETNTNSIIIIGANGSGKSKLGSWIEKQNMQNTHRIGAQRSLSFGDFIQLKSYEQAENLLFFGNENIDTSKGQRWNWGNSYTTKLLDDYENVLAALIAKKNKQHDEFIKWCKEKHERNENHHEIPFTVVDKLKDIWNSVFPQRQIYLDDAKVIAGYALHKGDGTNEEIKYKGKEMSDGERVALYLISQCLCLPEGKIIIIDEPELHLHRSIMNRLWTALENERKDCFFIYITHDTQFAATHREAKKIWIKSFNGNDTWEWDEIKESNLPEQLLLDIIGNRKPVLFVEGTTGSYDTKLYSEIYKEYYVVPCGSCSNVIIQTKAMNANEQLHHLKAYGIIDRDYRSDYEINAYKEHGIYSLAVAEVENLFLVEGLLRVINEHQGFNDDSIVKEIQNYIVNERFKKQINGQICESVVAEIKYMLSSCDISKKDENTAKQALDNAYANIKYDIVKSQKELLFSSVAKSNNYKDVLRVFNYKQLPQSVGHFFNLDNKDYCNLIIRLLKSSKRNLVVDAIIPYLPSEITI